MNRQAILDRLNAEAPALKRKYGVMSLAVFGSMARGDDHEGSDVDMLVTFEGPATFDNFFDLKFYLEEALGRSILSRPKRSGPRCGPGSSGSASMSRDWRIYLDDMVTGCSKVLRYTAGMTRTEFFDDEKTLDAVVRNIQIVDEASKHIPADIRQKMPTVEWKKIAGMRDLIVHAYFGIDPDILWFVIETKLPELLLSLQAFKEEEQS